MRELALATLRIVDELSVLTTEDTETFYTNVGGKAAPAASVTISGLEGHVPECETALVCLSPCNPGSALGEIVLGDGERELMDRCIAKLEAAGITLLDKDNARRKEIHVVSRLMCGDGVEMLDMIQFYVVFSVANGEAGPVAELEGVLRLDKIDFAIDEAILV